MSVVFLAVLLATLSQPAFALLYSSWGAPIVTDATGDSLATPNNGGTDISKLYYANADGFHYFRMDINGSITSIDHATYYQFIFNSGNSANINGVSAIWVGSGLMSSTPDFSRTDSTLEWKIPQEQLLGSFSLSGATISILDFPFIRLDDTTPSAAAPIPNAAWLLGSGLLGLVGLKRRNDRKSQGEKK
jgi:hypothetical protein